MKLKDFQEKYTPQIDNFLKEHLVTEIDNPTFSKILALQFYDLVSQELLRKAKDVVAYLPPLLNKT